MKIETKFSVGQKVWYLQDGSGYQAWCVEAKVLKVNVTSDGKNYHADYNVEYYDGCEYMKDNKREIALFASQEELLEYLRGRVLNYERPESQDDFNTQEIMEEIEIKYECGCHYFRYLEDVSEWLSRKHGRTILCSELESLVAPPECDFTIDGVKYHYTQK